MIFSLGINGLIGIGLLFVCFFFCWLCRGTAKLTGRKQVESQSREQGSETRHSASGMFFQKNPCKYIVDIYKHINLTSSTGDFDA